VKAWPFVAILAANAFAAGAIFFAGKWVGETNRYDGCQYVELSDMRAWLCPLPARKPPPPKRGVEA
jgi:hypothetical protein